MFCLSLKARVLFLSGHSHSFWVTALSAQSWGEVRRGCILAVLQARSSVLQPGTISWIICPQRPMHYRNENSFSDSIHCLACSNLAVRNSWPCRVGQWKGETGERPGLTQVSHCERIRLLRLSLTADCQGL